MPEGYTKQDKNIKEYQKIYLKITRQYKPNTKNTRNTNNHQNTRKYSNRPQNTKDLKTYQKMTRKYTQNTNNTKNTTKD